jgi:hypothetical protein
VRELVVEERRFPPTDEGTMGRLLNLPSTVDHTVVSAEPRGGPRDGGAAKGKAKGSLPVGAVGLGDIVVVVVVVVIVA